MAVINDPTTSTNIGRVGEVATGATGAIHMVGKPIPSSVGHYRTNHRCVLAATNGNVWWREDIFDDVNGVHPFVFIQNEGFEIENRALNATSFGFTAYIDHSFVELVAY